MLSLTFLRPSDFGLRFRPRTPGLLSELRLPNALFLLSPVPLLTQRRVHGHDRLQQRVGREYLEQLGLNPASALLDGLVPLYCWQTRPGHRQLTFSLLGVKSIRLNRLGRPPAYPRPAKPGCACSACIPILSAGSFYLFVPPIQHSLYCAMPPTETEKVLDDPAPPDTEALSCVTCKQRLKLPLSLPTQ